MPFRKDLIFNLFCKQVTILSFWIELDLIFAFFYMQVINIVFWTVLDLIFTFFCVQVITMCSLRNWTLYSPSSACR